MIIIERKWFTVQDGAMGQLPHHCSSAVVTCHTFVKYVRAFPMGLPKPNFNSNIVYKPKKWLPTD